MPDYGLGIYENRNYPEKRIVFGQYTVDHTKTENWVSFLKRIRGENTETLEKQYRYFQENYVLKGRISNEEMLENLAKIRQLLPESTELILLNGSEYPFPGNTNEMYVERHLLHRELNQLIRSFAEGYSNVHIVDITFILGGDDMYLDSISHFKKQVYYKIAKHIQEYLEQKHRLKLKTKSRLHLFYEKTTGYSGESEAKYGVSCMQS